MVECICGPNIGIITICVDLWWGQTQNGLSFDFEIEFDLEVHGQPPQEKKKKQKYINQDFYTPGPNLVIMVYISNRVTS